MKTLLTSAAIAATMSTSAMAFGSAGTPTHTLNWEGLTTDTTTSESGCSFVGITDPGTMTYDEDFNLWTVTTPAQTYVNVRNGSAAGDIRVSRVTVQPVDKDGDPGGQLQQLNTAGTTVVDTWPATVTYETNLGSSNTPDGWSLVITTGTPGVFATDSSLATYVDDAIGGGKTANLTSAIWRIDLGGTAYPDLASGELLDTNTKFRVQHMITCFQDTLDADL